MKRSVIVPLICVAVLLLCFGIDKRTQQTISHNIDTRKTIVIDAGHGGIDVGAVGIDNCYEKDINLAISLDLYDYLVVNGMRAHLIRSGDYEIYPDGIDRSRSDLYNRMDIVNSYNNSILVSVHQNHYSDESEWGTQIWYSANTVESKSIADNIMNNIKTFLQPNNNRSNKMSDNSYYLLYKATVPSIMVECGFISNREECIKLQDDEYQSDIAYSILLGLNGEI